MSREGKIPFFLIARYLKHGNKWTLMLTTFLMSVAFVNLVFITSLFNGIVEGTNDQIINTLTGHIVLMPNEGQDYFEQTNGMVKKVQQAAGVSGASPQTVVPGNLKYQNTKGSWQIIAIDPNEEQRVTNVAQKMVEGAYLSPEDSDQIIVGREIAGGRNGENTFSFKGLRVGDTINLSLDGINKDFTVKGIFDTHFTNTDERAFITEKGLEAMVPALADKATTISVRITEKGNEQAVIQQIKDQGVDTRFYTWQEMSGLMKSIASSFISINVLLTFVGVLIAAVTIFIVIYIDISNKKRQIGILRAIGIRAGIIRTTYVFQSFLYAFAGVLIGTVLFVGIIIPYFNFHPFQLPIVDAHMVIDYADFGIRAGVVILVAIVSGFIPAVMVTRMKILDAVLGK